jgi:ABC-type glycerol-3-phosphate transport system substrate-binding protein
LPRKTTKLKIWLISDAVFWRSDIYIVNYFDKLFENEPLTVEWRFIPWSNVWVELVNAFKAGEPPDIFEIGSSWVASLAEMNFLLPLNLDIFRKDYVVDWLERISIYKGKKVAIPWYVDLGMLTARKDILDLFGISTGSLKDWEGFYSSCKKVALNVLKGDSELKILPLGFSYRPEPSLLHNMIPFFWSNGWKFPDLNNPPFKIFSDERAIETFNYLASLWKVSLMPKTIAYTNSFIIQEGFFRGGNFLYFVTHWSPDIIKMLDNRPEMNDIKFPFIVIPYPEGKYGSFQWGGGSYLAVNSKTKSKDACFDFLIHFISDSYLLEKIKVESRFPPYKKVYEKVDIPSLLQVRDLIEKSKTYPSHPLWFIIEKFMTDGMSEILWYLTDVGEVDEEALKIAEKWDSLINEIFTTDWECHG